MSEREQAVREAHRIATIALVTLGVISCDALKSDEVDSEARQQLKGQERRLREAIADLAAMAPPKERARAVELVQVVRGAAKRIVAHKVRRSKLNARLKNDEAQHAAAFGELALLALRTHRGGGSR